ncbi:hypothetical protein F5Y13DRAFT_172146 [Hypoxylon sp. FL1857]|nr:hypothetical protein F5Y13DRAFT_172146 [Hypoxylon sp. FL1857]
MTNPQIASNNVLQQEMPRQVHTSDLSLSLTLALKDGALGTTPLSHQQTAASLLRADIPYIAAGIPHILLANVASMLGRRRGASWDELREVALYLLLSLLEIQLLISICLLWLVLPGLALLPCLSFQAASIWILIRCINSGPRSLTFTAGVSGDTTSGGDEKRVDWFVVGSLVHNERMRRGLPEKLAVIFGHDMRILLSYRLGFLFDAFLVLLQRNINIPTARSVTLYHSVRSSLLRSDTSGVRILAHHTGTLDVSWLLARLCADFPPGDRLAKLQVFTFGAASIEMTLPLGHLTQENEDAPRSLYPSVTHFAFTDDPVAQIGVLLGIRQRLEGRFIGSLYTIHTASLYPPKSCLFSRSYHYTFDDYLDTLLPGGDPRVGVLGQQCKIDRELSEMRELAALAQSITNERLRTRRARLSWTALGVVASSTSSGYKDRDDMSGPYSLEEVRKKAKSLEGLRGYESNPLVDTVMNRCYPCPRGTVTDAGVVEGPRNRYARNRHASNSKSGVRRRHS